jgi:Na+/H+-dicarboxylate symporter
MIAGIAVGRVFMAVRENAGAAVWTTINSILFADITAAGNEQAIGLFYIGGQLFIRSLQLIIVPMVFTSVVMAISEINEAKTLGRISAKTIGWFMMTTTIALVVAGAISLTCFSMGIFNIQIEGVEGATGSTGANPLKVILDIIPSNIGATFSVNNAVLGVVFLAVVVGLGLNTIGNGKESAIYKLCEEISELVTVQKMMDAVERKLKN